MLIVTCLPAAQVLSQPNRRLEIKKMFWFQPSSQQLEPKRLKQITYYVWTQMSFGSYLSDSRSSKRMPWQLNLRHACIDVLNSIFFALCVGYDGDIDVAVETGIFIERALVHVEGIAFRR